MINLKLNDQAKAFDVLLETEGASDAEDRLLAIYEFLLSNAGAQDES